MKLKYCFEIVEAGTGFCAVPVGENSEEFRGVLQLNDTGAKMLGYIGECETPEEVLEKLSADYPDDDKNEIGENLADFLNRLVKEGLLIP